MNIRDHELATEVNDRYFQLRQSGHSRASVVEMMTTEYQDELTLGLEDDGVIFWIALADAQYRLKELSLEVAMQAMAALTVLDNSDNRISPAEITLRWGWYSSAPMPEKKRISAGRKFRSTWKTGDVYAYRLSGSIADANGLLGKYILLRKVDELETWDGRLLPVVTLSLWAEEKLPFNSTEFRKAPLLKLANRRLGLPEDRYEYRVEIMFTNQRQLSQLQYLGCFEDIPDPRDEAIVRKPGYVLMLQPDKMNDECCMYYKMHQHYSNV